MDTYITITEATQRLGKSDRQIRRMIHAGKLRIKPPASGNSKLEILANDIDALSSHIVNAQQQARLDTLEHEVAALRQEVDNLSKQIDVLSQQREVYTRLLKPTTATYETKSIDTTSVKEHGQKATTAPLQRTTEGQQSTILPDGWIPLNDLLKRYPQAKRTTVIRNMGDIIHKGQWVVEGHECKNALDEQGQAEFLRRYAR